MIFVIRRVLFPNIISNYNSIIDTNYINYIMNCIRDMGESNESFFENVLLKNINEDIPINIDLSDTPEKDSASTMRTSTIS